MIQAVQPTEISIDTDCPLGDAATCMSILQRLSELSTQLATLNKELLGNGQPGRIQRVESAAAYATNRITMIEAKAEAMGGANTMRDSVIKIGLGSLFTAVVALLIHFFK